MQTEAEQTLCEIGVGEIDDRAPPLVRAEETADSIAACHDRIFESQPVEDGHSRRLQHYARADRCRRRNALEDDDAMPGAMQKERGGSPRRPTTDNSDFEPSHHTPTRRIWRFPDGVNGIGYRPGKHAWQELRRSPP